MFITEAPSGPQLKKTADGALDLACQRLNDAIKKQRDLGGVFDSLELPGNLNANHISTIATSEANARVDQLAGGIGNAVGARFYVQAAIFHRAAEVAGPKQQWPDSPKAVVDTLDQQSVAEPTSAGGFTAQGGPPSPVSSPAKHGENRSMSGSLTTPTDPFAKLLEALKHSPTTGEQIRSNSFSIIGL